MVSQSCIIFALAHTLVHKLRIITEIEEPSNIPPKSEFRRKMTARCIDISLSQCHRSLGPHTKATQKHIQSKLRIIIRLYIIKLLNESAEEVRYSTFEEVT